MTTTKKLIIFASGSKDGGGSGFQELVENSRTGILDAEIVGVVSNHANGGVKQRADKLGVHFIHFPKPWDAENYQQVVKESGAEWVSLSGWLKIVSGLDWKKVFNIHPGPLPEFGGPGMYGHYVHEAVIKAFQAGKIKNSAVSMHFVNEEYDKGPIFFRYPVLIRQDDTPETLAARVNKIEHAWQSYLTNLVIYEKIKWDGQDLNSLVVPEWYNFHKLKIN